MEILRERLIKSATTTIGPVSIDGIFQCYGLEPKDRGLKSGMSLAEVEYIKVPGVTCIAPGRYKVVKYFGPDHGTYVLRVLGVVGFDYIEIHVGNSAKDTKGCLLLGTGFSKDFVSNSKFAVAAFYKKVFAALDAGKEVWITYQ